MRPVADPEPDLVRGEWLRPGPISAGAWWRAAALLAVGLVMAFGLLAALWLLARPLALLLAAIVLAEALAPGIDWLERRMPRLAAVVLVYVGLVAFCGATGWLMISQLAGLAEEVLANMPTLIQRVEDLVDDWNPTAGRGVRQALETSAANSTALLVELPAELLSAAVASVLVVVMSAYWSIGVPALSDFGFSLLPERHRAKAGAVAREMVATMGGYIRARVLSALILAVLVYAMLLVLGVRYPLLLALLAWFGGLVPFVGAAAAAIPAVAVALLDSPAMALLLVVFYALLLQLKAHVLMPQLSYVQADIPPLLVIFALLAGGAVGGIVGALVAPPLLGALRVLAVEVIAPALRRWLVAAEAAGRPGA